MKQRLGIGIIGCGKISSVRHAPEYAASSEVSIIGYFDYNREARATGCRLLIAHNQRLWPLHIKAKQLIASGTIGRPLSFCTSFGHRGPDFWSVDRGAGTWFFDKVRSAFGAMADLGIHKLDLMRFLLDSDVAEVEAMMDTLDKRDGEGRLIGIEDNAVALYRMKNGVIGTVCASWTYYGNECNDTVIFGTGGQISISADDRCIRVCTAEGEGITYTLPEECSSGVTDDFVNAILHGTRPTNAAEDILPSMKALFATFKAASSGGRVYL